MLHTYAVIGFSRISVACPPHLERVEHLRTPLAVLGADGPRPHQERVGQGALAVVYVRDDAGSAKQKQERTPRRQGTGTPAEDTKKQEREPRKNLLHMYVPNRKR